MGDFRFFKSSEDEDEEERRDLKKLNPLGLAIGFTSFCSVAFVCTGDFCFSLISSIFLSGISTFGLISLEFGLGGGIGFGLRAGFSSGAGLETSVNGGLGVVSTLLDVLVTSTEAST